MADRASQDTGVETSLASRAVNFVRSSALSWLTSGQPAPVVAPKGTLPRAFDYPTNVNSDYIPRSGETFSFYTLRSLGDSYDLMRLFIETRKDQAKRQAGKFRRKQKDGETKKAYTEANANDKRVAELSKFFKSPDKEHSWKEWLGELLEEVLVIDAPCIYPRFARDGSLYAFEILDGATIKRVLSDEGRTPLYPNAAYQQVIKGVPAVNATAPNPQDKILPQFVYKPRNPRVAKVYGYSPVEQIAMTVNIALRRQMSQLQEYTEGSTPEAIIGCPTEWTPEQIAKYEEQWNSMLAGNTGQRKRARFVAGDAKNITLPKASLMKDEFDEWLAKIVAFAFSCSPQALVKQMNKASAEESVDAALSEGLQPILEYVKELINYLVETYFGYDDIEFVFEDDNTEDPKDLADIHDKYLKNGSMNIDEVRADLGLDAVGADKNMIYTMSGAIAVEDALTMSENGAKNSAQQSSPEAGGGSTSNGKKPDEQRPSPDNKVVKVKTLRISAGTTTHAMSEAIPVMRKYLAAFFKVEAERVAKEVKKAYAAELKRTAKADKKNPADRVMKDIDLDEWKKLQDELARILKGVYADGSKNALIELHVFDDAAIFDVISQAAIDYSKKRAAEMVGMQFNSDGELVTNPNPRWAITDTTRKRLRDIIVRGFTEGMTPDEVADAILESTAFSEARAEMIAQTEMARANVQATVQSWEASGLVVKKKWLMSNDHDIDDVCDDNASDGYIAIDKTFSSGDEAPPAHPRCACDVAAETEKNEDGTSEVAQ